MFKTLEIRLRLRQEQGKQWEKSRLGWAGGLLDNYKEILQLRGRVVQVLGIARCVFYS